MIKILKYNIYKYKSNIIINIKFHLEINYNIKYNKWIINLKIQMIIKINYLNNNNKIYSHIKNNKIALYHNNIQYKIKN